MDIPFIEENDQTEARKGHLEELRKLIGNPYPNRFERSSVTGGEDTITAVVREFKKHEPQVAEDERPSAEEIERANAELNKVEVRTSGRISSPPRVMGKAAFVHLSDGVSRLQIYVKKADVKGVHNDDGALVEEGWELFNLLDHGDFIGVEGFLFITRTGELSVHVRELQFLSKARLPMPDKMHGISDPEIRQRQRYADLIAGSLKVEREPGELTTREVFERRSAIVREMRRFLDEHGYVEVETPMLTPKATGAAARPFKTHHNALGIDLYARIAPELYLKRLVVGGFEKVYEINRNFRNEGIDRVHNPEFTMLEFYCAYMDVNGMMDFCEELLRTVTRKATKDTTARFENHVIDFGHKFARLTMKEAIYQYWPPDWRELGGETFKLEWLNDPDMIVKLSLFISGIDEELSRAVSKQIYWGAPLEEVHARTIEKMNRTAVEKKDVIWSEVNNIKNNSTLVQAETEEVTTARMIENMFGFIAERHLIQPTFITDFPKPVSPLSKASPENPSVAERFELFIAGMECANGFSELNDPVEQYERFLDQAAQRERGDEEAMVLDEDYIRALSYGMPPAAGIGIGVDRLVMLLTNQHSIRDVILFPHMRPERKAEAAKEEEA